MIKAKKELDALLKAEHQRLVAGVDSRRKAEASLAASSTIHSPSISSSIPSASQSQTFCFGWGLENRIPLRESSNDTSPSIPKVVSYGSSINEIPHAFVSNAYSNSPILFYTLTTSSLQAYALCPPHRIKDIRPDAAKDAVVCSSIHPPQSNSASSIKTRRTS